MANDKTYPLGGKVALITGATRGIGRAIAKSMAQAGATVAITGRSGGDLDALRDELEQGGARVATLVADLEAESDIERLVPWALSACSGLDILVNNAGIDIAGAAEDFALEDWRRTLSLNLETPFRLSQAAGRHFLSQDGGAIINISSVLGLSGAANQAAYAASKHGIVGLTKSLSVEWASRGVRVNAIAPGLIETDMPLSVMGLDAWEARIQARVPLRRIGKPEEIAGMAVFLASDAASYVHGQVFVVDGGRLAT